MATECINFMPSLTGNPETPSFCISITKTCSCDFYIEKLGFAGIYLFFLFLLQNIKAVQACTHNLCFEQE